jgi:hypothetical protein
MHDSVKTRLLNDQFRKSLRRGKVVATGGIAALLQLIVSYRPRGAFRHQESSTYSLDKSCPASRTRCAAVAPIRLNSSPRRLMPSK